MQDVCRHCGAAATKLLEDGLRARMAQRTAHAAAALLSFSNHPTPLACPPPGAAPQASLANLFGGSVSLTAEIPGRHDLPHRCAMMCC